jgi:hypothetical protein
MQPSPLIQRRTFCALLALLLASALGLRADPPLSELAEGGTASLLEEGGKTYVVHTFTTVGTTNFTVKVDELEVEYLVVAGGGGGGFGRGGGGGAGGYRTGTLNIVSAQTLSVIVGAGGAGVLGGQGINGGNSVFDAITADGGGGGGVLEVNSTSGIAAGKAGGSGGGAAAHALAGQPVRPVGTGVAGQGNDGGPGKNSGEPYSGGGGGGAGAVGGTAAGNNGGAGGAGLASSINGTSVNRGGGGG